MAAFEAVSQLVIKPLNSASRTGLIDLRTAELPFERPINDFDPRNHRSPHVIIKPWMAYINVLRAAVGLGMLGAPLATSQAGLAFGPFLILGIGCLLIHTHLMLLWCLNEICRQLRIPYVSYRYGVRLALLHGPPLLHTLGNWGPAAFEAVSQLVIKPLNSASRTGLIDLRTAELPFERPINDFDPRNHRSPHVIIKPWMAYINVLRAAVGLGMLGAPLATSQAGLAFGPFLILGIGCLLIHTHLMLLWCLNEICRQLRIPYVSYRYGVRLALLHGPPLLHTLGNWGPFIIAVFMFLSQLALSSVNIIFIADNLRDMTDWTYSSTSLMYMLLPVIVLEVSMKNLRVISYIINGANVMNLVALVLVITQIIRGPRRETQLGPLGWVSLLMAFGTLMFNMSAVGVILSCEKALQNPHIMSTKYGVVNVGLMVPTCITMIIGTSGAWAYGVMEENILRYLAYDDTVTMAALGLYSLSSALAYPLSCYPGYQIILEVIKNHDPYVEFQDKSLRQIQNVTRPIFVLLTFLIAYLIPYQGPFVAFVGSGCTTILSLVFPALMEIGLCYPDYFGRFHYILLKDLLIVVVGLVTCITGMVLCGYLLYVRIQTANAEIDDIN